MSFFNHWWNLPYLIMLGLVAAFFLLQIIGLIGDAGDHDIDHDHDVDVDGGGGGDADADADADAHAPPWPSAPETAHCPSSTSTPGTPCPSDRHSP